MKSITTLLLLFLSLSVAFSSEETYTERREGLSINTGSSVVLMDDKYPQMDSNPNWQNEFLNVSVKNKIWLGLNPEAKLTSNQSVEVEISFQYTDENGGTTADNCTLLAEYDIDGTLTITDKSSYTFTGGHLIEAEITNVTVLSGSIENFVLQFEIAVDRFYHFDNGAVVGCGVQPVGDNYLEFYWSHKAGAEEYELEYVHINDYTIYENAFKSPGTLPFDFYKNSTRVTTKDLSYRIPQIFDHGYLIFRVRGVGRTNPVIRNRKEGAWNVPGDGFVGDIPVNQQLHITQEYVELLNWSYQSAMTEDGKRMEGISFADGLGRPRQQLMHNPSTEQVIVSNTYYDYHGRPVIQDLGTPVENEELQYYQGFNLSAIDQQFYGPQHFDSESLGTDCPQLVHGFDESSGAGNYYSTANTGVDGADRYTPDAKGYPFAQIEYMPDQTGRIKRVGAYGKDHQIGEGNATKYMYSTPTQEELNRLFGSEVGYAHQYQRRMMQDANGQIYVTYYDLAGRVIGSGLAGNAPDGLDALTGSNPIGDFELTLIDGSTSRAPLTFSKSHSIESEGFYTFSYGLTPQEYQDACMDTEVCFDCVYKLELIITHEDCEAETIFTDEIYINGEEYDKMCSGENYALDTTIMLAQGDYNYTRILSIDPDATDEYWCLYMEDNQCIEDYSHYFNVLYNAEDFSDCEDFSYGIIDSTDYVDPSDECSSYRYMMKKQLSPTGQYAQFDIDQNTGDLVAGNYPLSIFNTGNNLPASNAVWNNPPIPYEDASGNPAMVTIQEVSPGVYEPEVANATLLTPTSDPDVFLTPPDNLMHALDFALRFEFSWADALLEYHPEYCYLAFCESNNLSNDYDLLMEHTHSHEEACDLGLYNPLDLDPFAYGAFTNQCATIAAADPFFAPGGAGEDYYNDMLDDMNNFIQHGAFDINIYWYAIVSVVYPDETEHTHLNLDSYPGDTCYNDRIWQAFRFFYQTTKEKYKQWAMTDYAMENSCYNGCFNDPNFDPAAEITPPPPTNTFNEYTLQNNPTPIYPSQDTDQPCHSSTASYYDDKIAVFGNYWNTFNNAPTNQSSSQNNFDSLQEVMCLSSCENAADDWVAGLQGCTNLTPATKSLIKAELIELCQMGCSDPAFPNGVSSIGTGQTSNGNTSFEEILEFHLGSTYFNEDCNIYLMNDLPPTHTSPEPESTYNSYLDDCGCDIIFQAKEDYETLKGQNNLPAGVESLIDMVEYNTGYLEMDAQHLLCECDKFYSGTWTGPGNWTSGDISALNAAEILVSQQMSCTDELTDCIDCQEANTVRDALDNYFISQGVNDIEEDPNYVSILGNYFNHHLDFMLMGDDYLNFIYGCNASIEDPYCYLSPETINLTEIIDLLAKRGQLLAAEASPIALETENIAYEEGLLNAVLGGDYFSCGTGQTCDAERLVLNFNSTEGDCQVDLDFGSGFAIPFEQLIGFHTLMIDQTDCSNNSMFMLMADFLVCGEIESHAVEVSTTCFETTICACGDNGQTLCNNPFPTPNEPACYKSALMDMEINAWELYEEPLSDLYADFSTNFEAKCMEALDTESFSVTGDYQMYQFTLFYYDQAGNLSQTIAPEGVDYLPQTDNTVINQARDNVSGHNDNSVTGKFPDHEFVTNYHYNSYGQLTSTTNPDQEGNTEYFYDRYGRIVASKNPNQGYVNKYSYTLYDTQGRPRQVGQVEQTAILTDAILKADDLGASFENWLGNNRSEVTITIYDEVLSPVIESQFTNGQNNLRLRVASILYFDDFHPINTNIQTDYTTATHYSYDLHGNVTETIQDVPMLAPVAQDQKKTEYDFELISGNMKAVHYQKDEIDGYTHFYHYDELNRLKEVETTTDNNVHRSTEARYQYYDYGPLARVELGEYQVQGMDYAYTINGWIKGMNSNTLDPGRDMGKDSRIGYLAQNQKVHRNFAKDVFGFTVNYFNEDYKAVGGSSFEADYSGTALGNYNQDLYNGNIRHVVTAIEGLDI